MGRVLILAFFILPQLSAKQLSVFIFSELYLTPFPLAWWLSKISSNILDI